MDSHICAQRLAVQYPQRDEPALTGLDLDITPGEFVLIAGPSGSGKSTLSRTLIGLIPHLTKGEIIDGELEVVGLDVLESQVHMLTQHVGIVFQDPETNIFSLVVLDELALGPENMGCSLEEIVQRVEDASRWVGVRHLWTRRSDKLSGGQKQRVAIAGVLAMMPKILVLDEPTTDLDPVGKKAVIGTLKHLKDELNVTIVVIEHDLSHLLEVADRLVIMGQQGRVLLDDSPAKVLSEGYDTLRQSGLRIPAFVDLGHDLRRAGCNVPHIPQSAQEAVSLISLFEHELADLRRSWEIRRADATGSGAGPLLDVEDLHFSYEAEKPVLDGINLSVHTGEFVALLGPNGAGKSTLLKAIAGLRRADRGNVRLRSHDGEVISRKAINDHVSFVFQDPNHQLFENTVWDEVAFSLRIRDEPEAVVEEKVADVLTKVRLLHVKDRHPATLSRGEKRRLAVATALSHPIELLLLDEPTTGQDLQTLEGLFSILQQLNKDNGTAILFVTHDMWTVWRYARRVIGMKDGVVVFDGPTEELLSPENAPLLEALELNLPLEAALYHAGNGIESAGFQKLANHYD